jgi:CRISPR-associated autoregulator DevR family
MDIVFYAGSLNYDQGFGNYQELKKITMYDGSVKILVSRWALRYSMLEMGRYLFKWKLAEGDDLQLTGQEDKGVVNPNYEKFVENGKVKKEILDFPEFDLFGFMITKTRGEKEGEGLVRTTPVKISHAISLNSYNFDNQFMANLGMMKRLGKAGSNPVNIEEFYGFYIYNMTVDLQRIGVLDDDPSKKIDDNLRKERIEQLIEIVMNLKRDIKGKREDLSPWLVVAGVYENMNYDTYMDKIELAKTNSTKVLRTERKTKEEDGKEVIEITQYEENTDRPKFRIVDFQQRDKVLVFKRDKVEIEGVEKDVLVDDKEEFINQLKEEIKEAFNN